MGHFCWMFCEPPSGNHQDSSNVWLLPVRTWLYSQPLRRSLRRRQGHMGTYHEEMSFLWKAAVGHRWTCWILWFYGFCAGFYGEWFWFWLMIVDMMNEMCEHSEHPNMGALHIFPHWYFCSTCPVAFDRLWVLFNVSIPLCWPRPNASLWRWMPWPFLWMRWGFCIVGVFRTYHIFQLSLLP